MSIEADLNAFRDLALEAQIRVPNHLARGEAPELVSEEICEELEEVLFDILGGDTKVFLTGEVYVPVCDDFGRANGMRLVASGEPVQGYSNGIDMVNNEDIPVLKNVAPGQFVVGYSVYVDSDDDSFDSGFAFAPVSSSTLTAPDLLVPTETLLPAEDDEVAEQIDLYLTSETPQLMALCKLFDELKNASSMQVDYYLNYVNRMFPLDSYDITIVTDKMLIGRLYEPMSENTAGEDDLWELRIQPAHFDCIYPHGLCIKVDYMLDDPEYDEFVYYPIKNMHKLQFRERTVDPVAEYGPEMN